jgi:hypothetical protein
MGYIREYYERIIQLSEPEWSFIASHFHQHVFARGAVITHKVSWKTISLLSSVVSYGSIYRALNRSLPSILAWTRGITSWAGAAIICSRQ